MSVCERCGASTVRPRGALGGHMTGSAACRAAEWAREAQDRGLVRVSEANLAAVNKYGVEQVYGPALAMNANGKRVVQTYAWVPAWAPILISVIARKRPRSASAIATFSRIEEALERAKHDKTFADALCAVAALASEETMEEAVWQYIRSEGLA